jgi:Predicted HD superfamily hydrolase
MALMFRVPVDTKKLIRGALLHDYFLYDWHIIDHNHRFHGFKHPKIALINAQRDLEISDIEKDIILRHMFPLTPIPPRYLESLIVCIADKICSVYETFYLN